MRLWTSRCRKLVGVHLGERTRGDDFDAYAPRLHRGAETVDENQIAVYARKCEHLIIDTRGRPELDHLQSLAEGCDVLIVPCTPDQLSIEVLLSMVGNLHKIAASRYRVLLTMVPPRPSSRGDQAREALLQAGIPLFKGEIRRTLAFQDAAMAANYPWGRRRCI
jgi:chromosome partitioning protein